MGAAEETGTCASSWANRCADLSSSISVTREVKCLVRWSSVYVACSIESDTREGMDGVVRLWEAKTAQS